MTSGSERALVRQTTSTASDEADERETMDPQTVDTQKIARTVGILFLLTFVTGIAGRLLFVSGLGGTWDNLGFIPGAGSDTAIYWGALFDFGVIATNIATAVVLYPILKRQSEIGAIGYLSARFVECAFILVGLLSLLTVVTARQDLTGAAGTAVGTALVGTYEWSFLFGPGLVAGLGNGLLLGWLMYRSGLVPRRMAVLGLIGGPVLAVGFICVLFGVIETGSVGQGAATAFEFVWELSLGIYLTVKGFRSGAITRTVDLREQPSMPSMATV
jgi:uncharacterized protein DUF4386